MIKMLGTGLLDAAETLKEELPAVIDIASKIVTVVAALAGLAT